MIECRLCDFVMIYFFYMLYDVVCEQVQLRLWNALAQDWLTILSCSDLFNLQRCKCIMLSGSGRSGSGLNFHNLELSYSPQTQIKFNFKSDSIQITIISNSNHNHFKLNRVNHVKFKIISNSIQISNHILFKLKPYSFERQNTPSSESALSSFRSTNPVLQDLQIQTRSSQPDWGLDSSQLQIQTHLQIPDFMQVQISDSTAGNEAQFLDLAMFQVFCSH